MLINNNKSSKTFKVLTLSFILKVRQGLHNMFQKPKTATTSTEQNNMRTSATRSRYLSTTNAPILKNKVTMNFLFTFVEDECFLLLNFSQSMYVKSFFWYIGKCYE